MVGTPATTGWFQAVPGTRMEDLIRFNSLALKLSLTLLYITSYRGTTLRYFVIQTNPMKTSLFNYNLPKNLIAQQPASPRDHLRLLVYNRPKVGRRFPNQRPEIIHDKFYNLKKYLHSGDVLVFNNTKVFPARLILDKPTGGQVEIFLLKDLGRGKWECLIGGRIKEIKKLEIPPSSLKGLRRAGKKLRDYLGCRIIKKMDSGNWQVRFNLTGDKFNKFLNKYGQAPTPPYIKTKSNLKKYQTIYAKYSGSVAAPTAGFHFTQKLLNDLKKFGVQTEFITLHVGLGTFAPVKAEKIQDHKIHSEFATIDKKTCQRLNRAKGNGQRIIAVGTTSLRTLESASQANGKLKPIHQWINLFILPGYKFKFVNAMITNFHLPKSSLLILISALVGRKKILKIYQQAIKLKYRFYSFGDAMFIR